jgi:RHS repeat-associated protein
MNQLIKLLLPFVLLLPRSPEALAGRHYDARIARWTTPDPSLNENTPGELAGIHDGMLLSTSPYSYTYGNPLKYVDPDGKLPILAPAAGAAVYIGGAVAIALAGHTWNYLTNASYRQMVDQGTSNLINVVGGALDDAVQNAREAYETSADALGNMMQAENSAAKDEGTDGRQADAKSKEEYDKHQQKLGEARDQLGQLEEKLAETKGPKRQQAIKDQIEKLKESIKGHEKEIRQKWPDGAPGT